MTQAIAKIKWQRKMIWANEILSLENLVCDREP
jgi:hypothetical protein